MCDDFEDFCDDAFYDESSDDLASGIEDESEETCEGRCLGNDFADFAILGGVVGYLEEEIEEKKRLELEIEKETESCCCSEDE